MDESVEPPASAPTPPLMPALRGFAFDLLAFLVGLAVLSTGTLVAWALFEAARTGDTARIAEAVAAPPLGVLLLVTVLATGVPAVLLYRWRRPRMAPAAPMPMRASALWSVGTGVAVFVLAAAIMALGARAGVPVQPSNNAVLQSAASSAPWALLAVAVLLAPVYEELLFRGVLFRRLWSAQRAVLGAVLSGVAFAALHEPPGLSAQALPAAALLWLTYGAMGAAFAAVYWRTRRLGAAIGAHAVNNALGTAGLWWSV